MGGVDNTAVGLGGADASLLVGCALLISSLMIHAVVVVRFCRSDVSGGNEGEKGKRTTRCKY